MPVATIGGRSGPTGRRVVFCVLLLGALLLPSSALPEFDPGGWLRFREIQVPASISEGIAAVALESAVVAKCKQDLSDLHIASSDGTLIPIWITPPIDAEEPAPFPARIFRVARKPGKWTEIWVDKTTKVLTREVILETGSKDFIRKVELRGSDNAKDAYVILMDGLVMDLIKPMPLRSLEIPHHLNNFQYLQLRILDDDQPPLKIENVLCGLPGSGSETTWPLDVRVMENRVVPSTNSTVLIADMGERRFPVTSVRISTASKGFVKAVRVLGGSEPSSEAWEKLYEGTVFRMSKDEAVKERLSAHFRPQLYRYIKLELSGAGAPVAVNQLEAHAAVRMAAFEYRKGVNYRLYYDNPQANAIENPTLNRNMTVETIASIAADVRLGQEQKGVPAKPLKATAATEEIQTSSLRKIAGIALLFAGLVLLFAMMLKARSRRRSSLHIGSRTFTTRL